MLPVPSKQCPLALLLIVLIQASIDYVPTCEAFASQRRYQHGIAPSTCPPFRQKASIAFLQTGAGESMEESSANIANRNPRNLPFEIAMEISKLVAASIVASVTLIAWEEVSMIHPMRTQIQQISTSTNANQNGVLSEHFGASTLRGMGFGVQERERVVLEDIEAADVRSLKSYNEIMLQHRQKRVSQWDDVMKQDITEASVVQAVRTVQQSLLHLIACKPLADNYEWDDLRERIRNPLLRGELERSCALLKSAKKVLSFEAREEIGFEWGSCAWRHCGALADIQEATDELDYAVGMLEPFECMFVMDVIERSLRDILDVTRAYQDTALAIPAYVPLIRMSDMADGGESEFTNDDMDYLEALSRLKSSDADGPE